MKKLVLVALFFSIWTSHSMAETFVCYDPGGETEVRNVPCNMPDFTTPYDVRVMETEGKQYVGKLISVNFNSIDSRALFQLVSDFSGHRLIIRPEVENKKIAVRFNDVPWDQVVYQVANGLNLQPIISKGLIIIEP